MHSKIIFLDIDGTLTLPGECIPPKSAVEAIRKTQTKGNLVFLCTGRNYNMLSPLLQYGFDGVIASSGAYICCENQVIYDCAMSDEERSHLLELLNSKGIFLMIECLDGTFSDGQYDLFLEEHLMEGANSELLRWRKQIEHSLNIRPMTEYCDQPVYKFVVIALNSGQLEEIQHLLPEGLQICIQEPDPFGYQNGEIIKKEYNKGIAVERVCQRLHLPIQDSIAFGDSNNDLEMLEKAGLSICMENGSAKLKKIADDICPAVEEDGLWKAFEKYDLL